MNELCERCTRGASGDDGHEALEFYVGGPYPGHHVFNCTSCGERWIRHCGLAERYAWTRYSQQFPIRRPRAPQVHARKVPS